MAPEPRVVPRFAAEPPQEVAPYGRWADTLATELRSAIDVEFGEIAWYPDRTWHGRTYVPATARTADGEEVFGVVSFRPGRTTTAASRPPCARSPTRPTTPPSRTPAGRWTCATR